MPYSNNIFPSAEPCGHLPLDQLLVDWEKQSIWIEHDGPTSIDLVSIQVGAGSSLFSCGNPGPWSLFTLSREKVRLNCQQTMWN